LRAEDSEKKGGIVAALKGNTIVLHQSGRGETGSLPLDEGGKKVIRKMKPDVPLESARRDGNHWREALGIQRNEKI